MGSLVSSCLSGGNLMLMFSGFPSGSLSMDGLCTLQRPCAFQSNSLFMLTCCGALWLFAVVGQCSGVLRLWVHYCWRSLCPWHSWAEIACGPIPGCLWISPVLSLHCPVVYLWINAEYLWLIRFNCL